MQMSAEQDSDTEAFFDASDIAPLTDGGDDGDDGKAGEEQSTESLKVEEEEEEEQHQHTESLVKRLNNEPGAFGLDEPTDVTDVPSTSAELLQERREREDALSAEEREALQSEAQSEKTIGNEAFGRGDYSEAVDAYTRALDKCPLQFATDRSTYLSNRAASFIKLEQFDLAIEDCSSALELGASNSKPLYRRAWCYEKKEETWEKALDDYQSLLQLEPTNASAREAIARLPGQINERNERMKEEMMGKLKDLGNLFLRPFGLSTDNFKLEPQPGGGYSVNMQK